MMRLVLDAICLVALLQLFVPTAASAYFDSGTMAYLTQILGGALVFLVFGFKRLQNHFKLMSKRPSGDQVSPDDGSQPKE